MRGLRWGKPSRLPRLPSAAAWAYLARRLVLGLVTLLGVSVLIFVITRVLPGNPARALAGINATPAQVKAEARQLGLNHSIIVQYWTFLRRAVVGNFGKSALNGQAVTQVVLQRAPATIELAGSATVLGTVVGLWAGVKAAYRPRRLADKIVAVTSAAGVAMPVFWLGLLLIILFSINTHFLPAAGDQHPDSIVLPCVSIAFFVYAVVARITRATMTDTLHREYIRTAYAKGCSARTILWRHALKNCAVPILTVVGLQFGTLLGGAVLTETVFGWPGMGQLLVNSINSQDLPVVQGVIIYFAALFILVNLTVDLLYVVLDPRVEHR